MTHAKANDGKSSLMLKNNASEVVLGRTRDMLGLTARLLGITSLAQTKAEAPERRSESCGRYGLEYIDAVTGMEFV